MLLTTMLACVASLPAVAQDARTVKPWGGDARVETVLAPIAARDSCIESVVLPFEARMELPGCSRTLRGTWASQGNHRMAYVLSGCLQARPTLSHVIWDGARTHEATSAAEWSELAAFRSAEPVKFSAEVVTPRVFGELLADPLMPGELGLFKVNHLWSTYLENFSDFRVLEKGRVGDVECDRVLCDQDGGAKAQKAPPPGYSFPYVLYVDRKHSLVRQVETYIQPSGTTDPAQVKAEWKLELEGKTFLLAQRTQVSEVHEAASNLWVGVEGTVLFRPWEQNLTASIRVDRTGIQLNNGVPAFLRNITLLPDGKIIDESSGGGR